MILPVIPGDHIPAFLADMDHRTDLIGREDP